MELTTGENDKGRRLDRILRKALPDHPLPLLHRLLRQKQVFVNGKPAKAQDRIDSGAVINIPLLQDTEKPAAKTCCNASLDIIWQDSGLLAVNKPSGVAVHGENSLNDMICSFLADKLPPSLSFTPGPLHRLDKPSSGIVIFSSSIEGARFFSSLLHERKVKKTYLAIVEGKITETQNWEDGLVRDKTIKKTFVSRGDFNGAKTAVTKITPLAQAEAYSLVMAEIATGRTHQIRAQAQAHGHPLAGDRKYGSREKGGFFLHAWKLEFAGFSIEAPVPDIFRKKIEAVFRVSI